MNRAAKIEQLRKQAQERLREFIPALFVKMFGDPVTNPMGWDVCDQEGTRDHPLVPFNQAVHDATRGAPKVKRREYLSDGPIPVVDQGREFISGYTTADNAYVGQLPVVLFGDHTRIFKIR